MALTPETGVGLTNADTYASAAEFVAYAAARGVTVTEGDAEVLLLKAMARMAGLEYRGSRVARDQSLDWPRENVCIDGFRYASTDLPAYLKKSQLAYAFAARTVDLMPVTEAGASGAIIEDTVGPITTRFAAGHASTTRASVPEADALLAKLLAFGSANTFRIQRA